MRTFSNTPPPVPDLPANRVKPHEQAIHEHKERLESLFSDEKETVELLGTYNTTSSEYQPASTEQNKVITPENVGPFFTQTTQGDITRQSNVTPRMILLPLIVSMLLLIQCIIICREVRTPKWLYLFGISGLTLSILVLCNLIAYGPLYKINWVRLHIRIVVYRILIPIMLILTIILSASSWNYVKTIQGRVISITTFSLSLLGILIRIFTYKRVWSFILKYFAPKFVVKYYINKYDTSQLKDNKWFTDIFDYWSNKRRIFLPEDDTKYQLTEKII